MTSQEGPTPSQEGRPDPWAAVVAIADELERSASALRRAMHYVPVLCHCGDPAAHTAGDDDGRMDDYCERCTSVRCDAYPGSCAPLYPAGSVAAVIRAHQWLGTSSSGHSQCSCNPDVWVDDYADHVAAALAAVVVSSPATPAEDADPFVADRHRLAGYLDACLDGLGHTDVHSSTWLEEFEADFPAPPPASPAETAHDPHAALAPELVGLLEDWDTNSEDDNYSKGQAADDLRAALTRACGCERGHLPHDRRCPTRLARSASPAETREGREAAEERAERWKRAIYSIDAPLTNCMALADAEIAAARADVAAEVKRAAERAGLDDQGNSGRVAFLILMDVAAALAASPAAVPLPDESWGGRMLAACDETCEATSLHHHTRTPDGRYWSKFGPAPAGLPTEPPSLPGEQPGGQQ